MVSDTNRRQLGADWQGSIVSTTDAVGYSLAINTYDEHGIPGTGNLTAERFQYTGQVWLPELGIYYYKARMYSPTLGRFMQTDPIGYGAGMNMYNYVGGDPVNHRDPSGLQQEELNPCQTRTFNNCIDYGEFEITGRRFCDSICEIQRMINNFNIDIMNGWRTGQTLDEGRVGGGSGRTGSERTPSQGACRNERECARQRVTPERRRQCAAALGAIFGGLTAAVLGDFEIAFAAASPMARGAALGRAGGGPGIMVGVIIGAVVAAGVVHARQESQVMQYCRGQI